MPEGSLSHRRHASGAPVASAAAGSKNLMSQEALEDRVRSVEQEQTRQGQELRNISDKVSDIGSGVKSLLERESKRPEGITWSQFGAGALSMLTLCAALWWTVNGLVEHSEAVVQINKRLDHAEFKYGWATRVEP